MVIVSDIVEGGGVVMNIALLICVCFFSSCQSRHYCRLSRVMRQLTPYLLDSFGWLLPYPEGENSAINGDWSR